jgi:hypothetical protein
VKSTLDTLQSTETMNQYLERVIQFATTRLTIHDMDEERGISAPSQAILILVTEINHVPGGFIPRLLPQPEIKPSFCGFWLS